MSFQLHLDWCESAYKYYQSFRILSFLGYLKQSRNSLCTSIEKFLKTLIMIRDNKTEDYVKNHYNHDLKSLFNDSSLDFNQFKIINYICQKFQYNKIRYEFEATTNKINLYHDKLNDEIVKLSHENINLLNKRYNSNVSYTYYQTITQDRKYKEYFLKRAFKSFDKTMRIDFT